jgi:hypothetical protein
MTMTPDESAASLALATKLSGGMQPPQGQQDPNAVPQPGQDQQGQDQQQQPDPKQQQQELDKRFAEFELKLRTDLEEKIGQEITQMTDVILGSLYPERAQYRTSNQAKCFEVEAV